MNTSKIGPDGTNNWVLCPSKKNPGKFYYFNVLTGDAVWSLNDNEKIIAKKPNSCNIEKINHTSHSYPEPSTSPEIIRNVTSSNTWSNTSPPNWPMFNRNPFQHKIVSQHPPIFGQPAMFGTNLGQYTPLPNIVWTPIQLPTWPCMAPGPRKSTIDRITQTSLTDGGLFVHNTDLPLCQRFGNHEIPSLRFNEEKIIKQPNIFSSSTPIRSANSEIEQFENQVPYPNIVKMETDSTHSVIEKSTISGIHKAPIWQDNSKSFNMSEIPNEKPSLSYCNKVDFDIDEPCVKYVKNLEDHDLRFVLMAKRKKLRKEILEAIERKKSKLDDLRPPIKKNISFNMGDPNLDSGNTSSENARYVTYPPLKKRTDSFSPISQSTAKSKCNVEEISMPKHNTAIAKDNFKIQDPFNNSTSGMPVYNPPNKEKIMNTAKNAFIHNNSNKNMTNLSANRITPYKIPSKIESMPTHNLPTKDSTSNIPIVTDQTIYNDELIKIDNNLPKYSKPIKEIGISMPIHNQVMEESEISSPMYNQAAREATNNTIHKPLRNEAYNNMPVNNQPTKKVICSIPKEVFNNTIHNQPTRYLSNKMDMPSKAFMPAQNESMKEGAKSQNVWYLVVDMDVMLEDYRFIDQLLQSDEKCRLLIPEALRDEIEAMCIGDCRGQERVLIARQISRKMSLSHKQYIVESSSPGEDANMNTTDSILNSCIRALNENYHVILITKDPHMQSRAIFHNIRCYKPQEIKNGDVINSFFLSELKKLKDIFNNKGDTQTLNSISVDMYKKDFFDDKRTDRNCDYLYNITKPKFNVRERDSNITQFEINRIKKMNMQELSQKSDQNSISNAFYSESYLHNSKNSNDNFQNQNPDTLTFENRILSLNTDLKIQKSKCFQNKNHNMKHLVDAATSADKKSINMTDKELNPGPDDTRNTQLRKDYCTEKITTATKYRTEKIFSMLSQKTSEINNSKSESIFKIPKLLPFKKGIKETSFPNDHSDANDKIRSNFENKLMIEGGLKKFCVKNKNMYEKIKSRMTEWICTYNQIMEDLLIDILQMNSKYTNDISVSGTNIQEYLTCVKMLYANSKLRSIIEGLVDLLTKCSCDKGKINLNTKPEDFMKIVGYGVLLVQTLKTILPTSGIMTDCEKNLNCMINNIETQHEEVDSELIRPAAVCRSEVVGNKDDRSNYIKDPAYVLEYLRNHFNDWSSYNIDEEQRETQKKTEKEDIKIVRFSGKNINMLKIDNNKSMSFTKTTIDNISTIKNKDETKIVRLLETNKPEESLRQLTSSNKDQFDKMRSQMTKENDLAANAKHKCMKIDRNITKNIDNSSNNQRITDENKKAGPEMIKNMQKIDKIEKKIENKEPLDLNILDYSEINDSSIESQSDRNCNNDIDNGKANSKKNNDFSPPNQNFPPQNNDNYANNNNYAINESNIITNNNHEEVTSASNANNNRILRSRKNITNHSEVDENYARKENTINVSNASNNENYASINEDYVNINENYARDDTTNDSGFENESNQAHSLIQMFLSYLSGTFKVVYEFVANFIKEAREDMTEKRKNILHIKASRCLQEMVAVIKQLRSIIIRESHEDTELKSLLLRAGPEATKDRRITKYRQIVLKCLEQAEILESALRIIVCVTIGDYDAISTNESLVSSIKYINIFE